MRAVPMLAVYGCVLLAGSPTSVVGRAGTTQRAGMSSPVYLIIRTDDFKCRIRHAPIRGASVNILAVGAHVDDVELGCLGTLLEKKRQGHNAYAVALAPGDERRVAIDHGSLSLVHLACGRGGEPPGIVNLRMKPTAGNAEA